LKAETQTEEGVVAHVCRISALWRLETGGS
jgi:hypothetical protein